MPKNDFYIYVALMMENDVMDGRIKSIGLCIKSLSTAGIQSWEMLMAANGVTLSFESTLFVDAGYSQIPLRANGGQNRKSANNDNGKD